MFKYLKIIKNKIIKIFIFMFSFIIFDFLKYKKLLKDDRLSLKLRDIQPIKNEKTKNTKFDRHYIYHPAWAARILAKIKPDYHIDISSTLHFCTVLSAFIPVKFYDYRPVNLNLTNLKTKHADLTNLNFEDESIKSLSCMHTVEHIGLGRYGDKINPNGDLKAIKELKRVLAINGNLLFVVPIGKPRIMFNAHRVYSYHQIMEYFHDLQLIEFSLITDGNKKEIIKNPDPKIIKKQHYGCGCFWFTK